MEQRQLRLACFYMVTKTTVSVNAQSKETSIQSELRTFRADEDADTQWGDHGQRKLSLRTRAGEQRALLAFNRSENPREHVMVAVEDVEEHLLVLPNLLILRFETTEDLLHQCVTEELCLARRRRANRHHLLQAYK